MQINRRVFTQLLAVLGVLPASTVMAAGKTVDVVMQNDTMPVFAPVSISISAGDTVRWTNKGVLIHTVNFAPAQATKRTDVVLPPGVAPFSSADMNQDDTYSHVFAVKGTYKYVCKYHEEMGMVGTVIVT